MRFFGKKREDEEELEEFEPVSKKIRKVKKEPAKPWGKKERYIVLGVFLATVLGSGMLALSAREYKLPGLPRLSLPKLEFSNPFEEQVIEIGNKKEKKEERIIKNFKESTNNLTGLYALYVIDLPTNKSFGVNENEIMQAASLIKLPVMLYIQGKVSNDKILAMGKRSDNTIFNEIVNKFGKSTLQNYIDTLGIPHTSLIDNETTPKDIGNLLKKIHLDNNKEIIDAITDTIYESWLTKGIPLDVKIAHKYGRETNVVNDAGVVYFDNPYIIVVMTQGIVDEEANNIIPQISKMVYDNLSR